MVRDGKFPWRSRLRNNLLGRSELIGKLGHPIAPVANALLANQLIRRLIDQAISIHKQAPLPAFSKERFSTWFSNRSNALRSERKVAYFHGCSTEYYEPWVGKAAVYVLEANGFEVIVPPQNCCGLPLLSNGEFEAARRYHLSNVRKLVEFANLEIPVVGTSTSCTLTLKEEANELLDFYNSDALAVANQIYDIHEFLRNFLIEGSFNLNFRPFAMRIAYHAPCQFQAHRVGSPSYDLLSLIPEIQIQESNTPCCGIAGTYGYKSEKFEIARDVGKPLFEFIRESDSSISACDSETCRWHIANETGFHAVHPVEILAKAYGFQVEGALVSIK
jgi:glycerol-3-phosphate dehydrogenase subunit C